MATSYCPSTPGTRELCCDALWITLYPLLLPRVRRWVYSSHLGAWYGQELDIVWDVILAAVFRTFEFALKAELEGIVVVSLERLSITIARNYYLDLLRKDGRIIHFEYEDLSPGEQAVISNKVDPIEAVSDAAYEEWLFTDVAKEVARFPKKTRTALLIDLANRMDFDDAEPTPLQRAFLEVGIRLKDYQGLIPDEPRARSRYASLLSVAYKRLARVISLKQYDSAA